MKKLSKQEINAMTEKIETIMDIANDEAKAEWLKSQEETIVDMTGMVYSDINQLKKSTRDYIMVKASRQNNEMFDIKTVREYIEKVLLEAFQPPYVYSKTRWNHTGDIERELILANIEAGSLEELMGKVMSKFLREEVK